jgi:hypothetical protein
MYYHRTKSLEHVPPPIARTKALGGNAGVLAHAAGLQLYSPVVQP